MSSFAPGGVSDARPAAFALLRSAAENRATENTAARQQRMDAQQRVSETATEQRSAAAQERQADAARQQAMLVQAATGSVLNVYA